jgi:hypothetical protein
MIVTEVFLEPHQTAELLQKDCAPNSWVMIPEPSTARIGPVPERLPFVWLKSDARPEGSSEIQCSHPMDLMSQRAQASIQPAKLLQLK